MKLRDEYIHGSDQLGVVKSIVSISGNKLQFKRADNSETVVDITIGNFEILFERLDKKLIEEELKKLHQK